MLYLWGMAEQKAKTAWDEINDRWKAVISRYMDNGLDRIEAYRHVYDQADERPYDSIKTLAWRLFTKVHFRAALSEKMEERCMPKSEALMRLSEQARNVQMGYLEPDGTIDLAGLIRDGYDHLVKETDLKGKDADRLVVKFYSVHDALDKILKAHGAYGARGTKEDPLIVAVIDPIAKLRLRLDHIRTGTGATGSNGGVPKDADAD